MTAFSATTERIIASLEDFPHEIKKQFLIDRITVYFGHGAIQTEEGNLKIIHMDNPEEVEEMLRIKINAMKRCTTISQVFIFINKPDRLQLLQFLSGVYVFTKKEYAQILRDCWISTEFPHQIPTPRLLRMFRSADTQFLMTDDERKALGAMPDEIKVYRGWTETNVRKGMTKRKGLAWTIDETIAMWFAKRWSHPDAKIATGTIRKSDVYMYTNDRNEQELVLNPNKIRDYKVVDTL